MNFFKRAMISIKRKPTKSVILLVLILILGILVSGAMSVKQAITNTKNAVLNKMNPEVSISLDVTGIFTQGDKELSSIESLTPEIIDSIGNLPQVKYYDYSSSTSLICDDLKKYEIESSSSSGSSTGSMNGKDFMGNNNSNSFTVKGGNNSTISIIADGSATLSEGKTFTDEDLKNGSDLLLISKNFAETNNLSVGSTVTLTKNIMKRSSNSGDKMSQMKGEVVDSFDTDYTIIGIFETEASVSTNSDGELVESVNENDNVLFTTNGSIQKINDISSQKEEEINGTATKNMNYNSITPTYILNDFTQFEEFTTSATALLPDNYKLTGSVEEFETMSAPLDNMGWIADIVLYVSIGATILILSLLITLFLRDRKHEMGIYLSIGVKKVHIAMQILCEVLAIALISITISIFAGNKISEGMSSSMLQTQLTQEQSSSIKQGMQGNNKNGMTMGDRNSMMNQIMGGGSSNSQKTTDSILAEYDVSLDGSTIAIIFLIELLAIIISTIIPILYTLRLNPKKILM